MVGGSRVVREGRHLRRDAIAGAWGATVTRLA
jgi:hypothetical protein